MTGILLFFFTVFLEVWAAYLIFTLQMFGEPAREWSEKPWFELRGRRGTCLPDFSEWTLPSDMIQAVGAG